MKIIIILLLTSFGTFALANTDLNLLKDNEKTIQKIRYYENKLFSSSGIDLSHMNVNWEKQFIPKEEANRWSRRYVSYNLTEPSSPFVILVIPFQKLIQFNNKNFIKIKPKN